MNLVGFVVVVEDVTTAQGKDTPKWITIYVMYVKGVVYVLIAKGVERLKMNHIIEIEIEAHN
ncbi:hypothetical protein FACS1894102_4750 [Spirochaetia bacterium]|nr:hypothetical protein FACS1894102_4750 [Spirochaetia bacterium]